MNSVWHYALSFVLILFQLYRAGLEARKINLITAKVNPLQSFEEIITNKLIGLGFCHIIHKILNSLPVYKHHQLFSIEMYVGGLVIKSLLNDDTTK